MKSKNGTIYTIGFAAAVCLVCSVFVSLSAVMLKDRQEINKEIDRQKNVLKAAGMISAEENPSIEDVALKFKSIKTVVVNLKSGTIDDKTDPSSINMRAAISDNAKSHAVNKNSAKIQRVPDKAIVYLVIKKQKPSMIVLPVSGKGLWSTIYGFLALDADTTTVKGVSFYEHGETPGLGGEIENPQWTATWKGKKVFDKKFKPAFKVIKGVAKSPSDQPHSVDGLSGATLTCKGVTALINFWIGTDGFGPFLQKLREGGLQYDR
jgi:Na+-transporting NADH:ubiquinone oxidoreductase subunit C